ncbi:hypothetical protein ACFVHW_04125 [Streptomyces sp. NPDC127110]|uniref:hypothetical protein n=1 Tax=Streptomyces sp. NPDC127110 TaxID=3345362 RepID=UPI0036430AAB
MSAGASTEPVLRGGAQQAPAYEGGVADRATGEIRILKDRCGTCVLNPAATAIPLGPGRRQEFVNKARAEENGYVVCHNTYGDEVPPGTRKAICRGFVKAYGLPPIMLMVLAMGNGHLVEVPDPMAAKQQPEEMQDWYRHWLATGEVECADCGTTVRCENLETLPDHRCTERQRARRIRS